MECDDNQNNQTGIQFATRRSSNRTYCCVFDCKSNTQKNPTFSFHVFPKAGKSFVKFVNKFNIEETVDRRWLWQKLLKVKSFSPKSQVCSNHFKKDDYVLPG